MTDQARLARLTSVDATERLLAIPPLVVAPGDDVLDVLRRAAAQPQTRVIGVVDDASGRLVGVIPVPRLVEAVVARVAPELAMAELADAEDVAQFGHDVETRTAADAMFPPAAVPRHATLEDAYREMEARDLPGLYVVDEAGRPVGYLDVLELAIVYMRALEAEGDDPDAGPDAWRSTTPNQPRFPVAVSLSQEPKSSGHGGSPTQPETQARPEPRAQPGPPGPPTP